MGHSIMQRIRDLAKERSEAQQLFGVLNRHGQQLQEVRARSGDRTSLMADRHHVIAAHTWLSRLTEQQSSWLDTGRSNELVALQKMVVKLSGLLAGEMLAEWARCFARGVADEKTINDAIVQLEAVSGLPCDEPSSAVAALELARRWCLGVGSFDMGRCFDTHVSESRYHLLVHPLVYTPFPGSTTTSCSAAPCSRRNR